MRPRTDLDHDGAGRPEYNAAAEDYITEQAERIGITFDEAAKIYERARAYPFYAPLHEMEPIEASED